ncbi:hypothetical protein PRIPAC_71046 [Pristionchus pacificus]|uniref:C2H2-type domain-containing protein n=1 Tax=Pristionchus pacificus TaxID=54126 RepID=A0A454Y0E9_PRIPA|nr:hypothetical protein PRIPAC_71046 [Pristionchus pacificus]|eukprot:PDM74991.1 hypothetical protein PRIPAC_40372 [Pristionchus pacificus]
MYACTFCDRTFDDKDERTKHRVEIHPLMRGTKGQCCVCARPFPGLFPFMDHMDEIHPVETAQIVVAPENQLRAYGWQYQEAFFEEGKDHRFNNMDYIIHINKLKRRQEEKELEESDDDDDDDDEYSYEGEEEQKDDQEVAQVPSPAQTEGYLDDAEIEKEDDQEDSTEVPIDIKPVILKFGVAEDANRKRSQIVEIPAESKRHRGLTERDFNLPLSSSSSIIPPQFPWNDQPQQQQVHQQHSTFPTQTIPTNQYKISPFPTNHIKTSPPFPTNQYKPNPPFPPAIPPFHPHMQQGMPYPSGHFAPNFPQYPMMHPQMNPQMQYYAQQQAQFGLSNPAFAPQMNNMWQFPTIQPLLPNMSAAMSGNSSSYVPMTPSPTSSNITGQSNDGTKKEEMGSVSRISTPSEMKLKEDLKEPQQGNVFGHIQFPNGTTQEQMNEAILNYANSFAQNGPSTSAAFPSLQQPLNVQISDHQIVQEENMPQLSAEIDPVGLSPVETKPVVFLPKTPTVSTDIISVKPISPNFTTVSSDPPALAPQSPLDKDVEATIRAAAADIENEMEEGEIEDGTPLIQQAISAMLYGGGTRNSTIGAPTFLHANTAPCQADINYWTGKSTNTCPRCGICVNSRTMRKSHYERCHFKEFYSLSRSRLSDIEKWLSIRLGKDSNERRETRICVHCPKKNWNFQGRTALLMHLESDHENIFHEYGLDYVRTFTDKHSKTSNVDLHNHLVRAAALPPQ